MALDFFKKEAIQGPEFQSPPLVILHLSDLHFQDPHFDMSRGRVTRRFFRALIRHMEGWRARYPAKKNLDALFIAGDVSYQCRSEDFEEAQELIPDLLGLTGIPGERLYVVPGEHDVYLKFIENTDDTLQFPDPASWNQFLRDERKGRSQRIAGRLDAYFQFIRSLGNDYGTRMPCASSDFFYADVFGHGDRQVAVIGLNSAWSCPCRMEADRGMLCLGTFQVGEAMKRARQINSDQAPDLVLSLVHHPAGLAQTGGPRSPGPTHPGLPPGLPEPYPQGRTPIRRGRLPGPHDQHLAPLPGRTLPGFSIVAIDLAGAKAHVWPYIWSKEKGAFLPPLEHDFPGQEQDYFSMDLPKTLASSSV